MRRGFLSRIAESNRRKAFLRAAYDDARAEVIEPVAFPANADLPSASLEPPRRDDFPRHGFGQVWPE